MSKANRKGEYDRLIKVGREPPEVLVKEFGKSKQEPKQVEKPKPVSEKKEVK